MNKLLLIGMAVIILFGSGVLLFSCNGNDVLITTARVSLYITDDISLYSQVTATVNRVQLVHTGSGTACNVLTTPVAVNIATLSDVLQLVNVTECVPGSYNRLHLEFDRRTHLMSETTGTLTPCLFTSYKNEGSGNQPNVLTCNNAAGTCTLDINGAVQVLAARDNAVALDFDLKNFDVTGLGTGACAVSMKVSPLTPADTDTKAVTGTISRLDTAGKTFDLTRGNRTYVVLYSGVTATQQGIDALLIRAQADGLRTRVTTTSGIDFTSNRITASRVEVKMEGTVSELVTDASFTVHYGTGQTRNIGVAYDDADVSGIISNGSWVHVKLTGHDPATSLFIAGKVEVRTAGMMTED